MVTLLVLLVAVPAVSPEAWVAGPLAKILPSTLPPASGVPGGGARAILDGARSQHVQFQIALRPALGGSTLRSLAVVPSGLSPVGGGSRRRPAIGSAAFSPARRVVCLHVSNKDGTSAGVWPDPLPLLTSDLNATIAPNSTAALWVEVAVPRNAAPGEYAGSVAVLAAGQLVVRVPVGLKVWNFSVAQRSLRTDSKLSEQWVSRFRAREQHGANLTNIVLNYYREMVAHRVTMMGWGGVSIFPSVAATFTPDLSAVSLETAGWDAMVSELQAMGLTQLHFPLVAQCACCEPITHIRTPIPQVIPPNATWFLASGQPAISVFDADRSTLEKPVLNATFVRGLTAYTRAVVRHLDAKGWLHAAGVAPHPPPAGGVLNANYMLFIDEVDITDPFTARALLLINRLLKTLEPRLEIAQTRFPTNQYGAQNQTLVREIEGAVDLWVASIDEWSNAAASDRVPQRLAKLGSARTMLYGLRVIIVIVIIIIIIIIIIIMPSRTLDWLGFASVLRYDRYDTDSQSSDTTEQVRQLRPEHHGRWRAGAALRVGALVDPRRQQQPHARQRSWRVAVVVHGRRLDLRSVAHAQHGRGRWLLVSVVSTARERERERADSEHPLGDLAPGPRGVGVLLPPAAPACGWPGAGKSGGGGAGSAGRGGGARRFHRFRGPVTGMCLHYHRHVLVKKLRL
jgi:hypothetical protein